MLESGSTSGNISVSVVVPVYIITSVRRDTCNLRLLWNPLILLCVEHITVL